MGSYNMSCGITGVNINPTEEVIGYFLVENPNPTITQPALYYNLFLDWVGLECVYNDYGRFVFKDQEASDRFIQYLNEVVLEMEEGENHYHQSAVSKGSITADNIFDLIGDDRIYVRHGLGDGMQKQLDHTNFIDGTYHVANAYKVTFVAFKKEAYDKIVNGSLSASYKSDMIERSKKYGTEDHTDRFDQYMAEKFGEPLPEKDDEDFFFSATRSGEHNMCYQRVVRGKDMKIEWNKTYLLYKFFDRIRKSILPSMYAGQMSVEEDLEYFDLFQKVQRIEIENEMNSYDDWDDEE